MVQDGNTFQALASRTAHAPLAERLGVSFFQRRQVSRISHTTRWVPTVGVFGMCSYKVPFLTKHPLDYRSPTRRP
jgi:hypothetical protein